jgi:Domain of unknown function (DUF6265)
MKTLTTLLAVLVLTFSHSARAGHLDWMIGCWESPDRTALEVWVKDNDGSLSGFSVTLRDGQFIFHEVLRVTTAADGTVSYTAHPDGQSTTTFKTTTVSGQTVTFSNPSHDYPQEVTYKRDGDKLDATISALNGKNPTTFNKQACK